MIEKPPVIILNEPGETNKRNGDGVKTICFDIDVFDQPVHFDIRVAEQQIRLSDIVPLARKLSTRLAIIVLERLRSNGEFIPCCKGCSACCNYLIPLSIPEAFRLREEILALPAEQSRKVIKSCLDTAKIILDEKSQESQISESLKTNYRTQLNKLSSWYSSLKLACPFLSDDLCTSYAHRPVACREHIVTGSALLCVDEWPAAYSPKQRQLMVDKSQTVQMPVSILECLGQLTARLEHSEIEAVILPLALPWVLENLDRGERRWPAVAVVESFIEILQANNADQSKVAMTKKHQLCT